ncbi:MAG: hypothetical protein M3384_18950 [Acidobacteriota bacterium]|nr:hypothetical protein [Acidobacteriota bacterium]
MSESSAQLSSGSNDNSKAPNTVKQKADFASIEGGFSIALPSVVNSYSTIAPIEGISKGGTMYTWKVPQGMIAISFIDFISETTDTEQVIKTGADSLIENITNKGGVLIGKKEITFSGSRGQEIRLRSKDGYKIIGRHYFVKNRFYNLSAVWESNADEALLLIIFNSFKLLNEKSLDVNR